MATLRETLHREMEACRRALLAADQAHVRDAMAGFRWERRGLLQRLTRHAP